MTVVSCDPQLTALREVRCVESPPPTSRDPRELHPHSPMMSLLFIMCHCCHSNSESQSTTTYAQDFHGSLQESLVERLRSCPIHVRCLRSNDSQTAGHFDREVIGHQIQHLGVFETVDFMQCGEWTACVLHHHDIILNASP